MANKKTKKKSTQAAPAASAAPEPKKVNAKKAAPKKADAKKGASTQIAKGKIAAPAKKASKAKNAKPNFLTRTKKYFGAVRSEMKRVVWPSKKELINYSVAVVVSLIVVGVVIAGLDTIITEGLVLFSGLRG